jgi:hypothetical protein
MRRYTVSLALQLTMYSILNPLIERYDYMKKHKITAKQRERIRKSSLDAAANCLARCISDDVSFGYWFLERFIHHYGFITTAQRRKMLNFKLPGNLNGVPLNDYDTTGDRAGKKNPKRIHGDLERDIGFDRRRGL